MDDLSLCTKSLDGLVELPNKPVEHPRREDFPKTKRIAFCGPSHSGKSAMINTLLDIPQLLPTGPGHTTGRICIIRYSPTICIKFYTLKVDRLQCLDNETITMESNVFNIEAKRNLKLLIKQNLERPDGIENDYDIYNEWASKIVSIEFPSPLLKPGLEIIDTPGFSGWENRIQFAIRKDFFNLYQPSGVIFCYPNSVFTDAEVKSLDSILKSLPSDSTAKDSIFFVNTKVSEKDIGLSNNIELGTEVPLDLIINHRIGLLSKLMVSHPKTTIDDTRFAIIDCLDFVRFPKSPNPRYMFHQFIDRLTKWIASLHPQMVVYPFGEVEQECRTMSTKIELVQSVISNISDHNKLMRESELMLTNFASMVTISLNKLIGNIPTIVRRTISSVLDFVDKHASNDVAMRIQVVDFLRAEIILKVNCLIEEMVTSSIVTIVMSLFEEVTPVNLMIRFGMKTFQSIVNNQFVTALSKGLSGMINNTLEEGFLAYFIAPTTMDNNGLKGLISKYPDSIKTKDIEKQVEQAINRKFMMLRSMVALQIKVIESKSSPNMLNDLLTKSLDQLNALYLNVLALHCKLHLPFESLQVDRSKIVKPGKDKAVMSNLLKQVRMSNDVNFIPMTLQAIFKQNDGANDDVEWILLYNQLNSFEQLLKDQISSKTIFLVTQMFQSLFPGW
ncbi:hypothetical protein SAMD00019534_114590 [Acytostelium subglobosum LB1]|uniref:hypothetical protein n=1 Tax=Acytostelium subglobosum LB1 TaxID=1410327 RepID=UPI000644BF9A|nr:hypothetical protein SAMD00019534_114590 [Acytostelium subglobosum LB1]GAM28283.1 hypothetical protein SAMD00019534_114590 [Acytostelium subglobosum LB1]|eukprot:XP_012748917.1 hypothetical protein SAMD00019534_114590 [Acytostelium subglobosum LB1]